MSLSTSQLDDLNHLLLDICSQSILLVAPVILDLLASSAELEGPQDYPPFGQPPVYPSFDDMPSESIYTHAQLLMLVDKLLEVSSKNAGGNFGLDVYNQIASDLAKEFPSEPRRTGAQAKAQYTKLKSIYKVILTFGNKSGAGGSPDNRGSICFEGDTKEHFLDALTKARLPARKFWNEYGGKTWPFFDKIHQLSFAGTATGQLVYRPGMTSLQTATSIPPSSPAPGTWSHVTSNFPSAPSGHYASSPAPFAPSSPSTFASSPTPPIPSSQLSSTSTPSFVPNTYSPLAHLNDGYDSDDQQYAPMFSFDHLQASLPQPQSSSGGSMPLSALMTWQAQLPTESGLVPPQSSTPATSITGSSGKRQRLVTDEGSQPSAGKRSVASIRRTTVSRAQTTNEQFAASVLHFGSALSQVATTVDQARLDSDKSSIIAITKLINTHPTLSDRQKARLIIHYSHHGQDGALQATGALGAAPEVRKEMWDLILETL